MSALLSWRRVLGNDRYRKAEGVIWDIRDWPGFIKGLLSLVSWLGLAIGSGIIAGKLKHPLNTIEPLNSFVNSLPGLLAFPIILIIVFLPGFFFLYVHFCVLKVLNGERRYYNSSCICEEALDYVGTLAVCIGFIIIYMFVYTIAAPY